MALAGALLRLWAMKILAKHFTFEVGIVKDHKCASLSSHRTIGVLVDVCATHLPWASVNFMSTPHKTGISMQVGAVRALPTYQASR